MKDSRSKRWGQCEQAAAPLQAQSNSTLGTAFGEGPLTTKNAVAPKTPSLNLRFFSLASIDRLVSVDTHRTS
jgi:hypothetical protein